MSVPVLSQLFIVADSPRMKGTQINHSSSRRTTNKRNAIQTSQDQPFPLSPQSQSFSRSYGSILPTSLIYIVLSTRGFSPWRPAAVMSTTWLESYSFPRIFKGRRERTGPDKGVELYQPLNPSSGQTDFRVTDR